MNNDLIKIVKENSVKQFTDSKNKNIFCQSGKILSFSESAKNNIKLMRQYKDSISDSDKEYLISFLVHGLVYNLTSVNQYYNFSKKDYQKIKILYLTLYDEIINSNLTDLELEDNHFTRIQEFIKTTNPSIYKQNLNNNYSVLKAVCAEYSAEFQIDLLGIEINKIEQPVLDIGCGKAGSLVNFFISKNIKTFGIDRAVKNNANFLKTNWLEYNYGLEKWGTVISNISFSSHFLNHFLSNDNFVNDYSHTYINILKSLKKGGKFIYAPSLIMIENLLDTSLYEIIRENIDNIFCKTIIIKK